jgi:WD40 repeat protein
LENLLWRGSLRSADGKEIKGTDVMNGVFSFLELWDVQKPDWRCHWRVHTRPNVFRFSPDGRFIVVADKGGVEQSWSGTGTDKQWVISPGLKILNTENGRIERTLTTRSIDQIVFSSTGRYLLAVSRARRKEGQKPETGGKYLVEVILGQATLYDMETWQELQNWGISEGTWLSCAITPDGKSIGTGDRMGVIRLYDTLTGSEQVYWHAHEGDCSALLFHSDGHTLISGGSDGLVKVWNLAIIRKELSAIGLDW